MSGLHMLAKLGMGGERSRRAQDQLGRVSAELVGSLRRVMPFLIRKRVAVIAAPPRTTLFEELDVAVPNIAFSVAFVGGPTKTAGRLVIDGMGLSRVLDGIMGGGEEAGTALEAGSLSSAQAALAERAFATVLGAFSDVLRAKLGFGVEAVRATPGGAASGACVMISLAIAGGGVIALAVPVSLLSDGESAVESNDSRVAAAMIDVEVDVVAELGKVRMSLTSLANLQVGDVVQLSLSLDERARVCAGGAVLFRGRPTATGLAIGIAIERHAT